MILCTVVGGGKYTTTSIVMGPISNSSQHGMEACHGQSTLPIIARIVGMVGNENPLEGCMFIICLLVDFPN